MEFALTAPVFLLLLMGIFDYCWQMYAQQVLQGAVAKAGRDATIEAYAVNQSQLDQRVQAQVQRVFRDAQLTFKRSAYDDFASIKEPIPVDCDGDGKVDYYDDGGQAGNGGAERAARPGDKSPPHAPASGGRMTVAWPASRVRPPSAMLKA